MAQDAPRKLELDILPVDTSKGAITDTLMFDINGDNFKDLILGYTFEYNQKEAETVTAILILYSRQKGNRYYYKNKNQTLLGVIQYKIYTKDSTSFVVEQVARRNYNKFYCYFQYDPKLRNWFLIKDEVIRDIGKLKVDPKTKAVSTTERERTTLREKTYSNINKIPFEKVSFWELFKDYAQ